MGGPVLRCDRAGCYWDLVKDWTREEREAMRSAVPKLAFRTPFRNTTVLELARRMLEIASHGLRARAALDSAGASEDGFLQPLQELVDRGYTSGGVAFTLSG